MISGCHNSEDILTGEVKSLKVTLEQKQEKLVNAEAEGQAWRRKFCQAQDMADKLSGMCYECLFDSAVCVTESFCTV